MPFVSVEGGQLNYELDGDLNLPVLVLSNPEGTNLSMWNAQIPALTQHFCVLRYDSFGHGASSHSGGEYKLDMLAKDVVRLLDALNVSAAHFCGISIGGLVGQWLCLNTSRRIAKLVLCNTGVRIGSKEKWNAAIDAVNKGGTQAISQSVVEQWFSPAFRESDPGAASRFREMLESTPAEGYAATLAAIRDADFRVDISRLRVKTLVIAGTQDKVATPEDGRFLAERILGSRYVELNAGHLLNVEMPQRFSEEILKFLSR